MNESDVIEHLFSIYDRYWTIVQWWASVSFSLIIVAYFAADRLSKGIVATLISLYSLYSIWVYLLMAYNISIATALIADLELLRASKELMSQGALATLKYPFLAHGTWLGTIAQLATFMACIGYLLYAYVQGIKNADT